MVVVRELGCRKKLVPVILLIVGEKPDELLELLVDTLRLAVGLRVVCRRGGRGYAGQPPELGGKFHDELRTPV